MFLLAQLQAIANNPIPTKKKKSFPRKPVEGLTPREKEHFDALVSMGGKGTTNDIGLRVKGMYYSGFAYLRKLEAKGFIRIVGAVDRDGHNPQYIWEVVGTEKQHS